MILNIWSQIAWILVISVFSLIKIGQQNTLHDLVLGVMFLGVKCEMIKKLKLLCVSLLFLFLKGHEIW